jgi:hypothetical protein
VSSSIPVTMIISMSVRSIVMSTMTMYSRASYMVIPLESEGKWSIPTTG